MFKIIQLLSLLSCVLLAAIEASACDLCALYNSVESEQIQGGTFRLGLAEQFGSLSKIQEDGHKIDNMAHQHLQNSTIQAIGTYGITDSLGLSLTIPSIYRRYKRVEDGAIDKGSVSGLGDMSLIARGTVFKYNRGESSLIAQLYGGLKLPTGSSYLLAESHTDMGMGEVHNNSSTESMGEMSESEHAKHSVGAIHGHDLALGTGSLDVPFGASIFARQQRLFAVAEAWYTIRNKGAHGYEAADSLTWTAGPGVYLFSDKEMSIAVKANFSGEIKALDHSYGELEGSSGINASFVGPRFIANAQYRLHAELGMDFPLAIDNTGIQAVTTYRLMGAVVVRF